MNIRRGEVAEVVSFYSYLQLPHDCVRVCTGPVCDCFGARDLLDQAQERADGGVPVIEVPCLGHCDLAPVGTHGDAILPGLVEVAVTHGANDGPSTGLAQADETLADYERRGGLEALRAEHSNEAVLTELEASGLVGYGGAGFPTFRKWATVVQYAGPRVVVVNADEGEPARSRTATSWSCGRICSSREWRSQPGFVEAESRSSTYERNTQPPGRASSRRSRSSVRPGCWARCRSRS